MHTILYFFTVAVNQITLPPRTVLQLSIYVMFASLKEEQLQETNFFKSIKCCHYINKHDQH